MSDPSSQPTQPLTDEDFEELREYATSDNLDLTPQTQQRAWELLLVSYNELSRLRAEVAGYRSAICFETTCTGCAGMLDQLVRAEAEIDRLRAENTAQAAKLDAVRSLPAIEIGIYWNAQSEAEATGRNATLLEVRRLLNGGEPQRADRSQVEICRDFERDMRTVRALGLDQDGRGQA